MRPNGRSVYEISSSSNPSMRRGAAGPEQVRQGSYSDPPG